MALLSKIDRFSSVSGGSITAALLGLKWNALLEAKFSRDAFVSQIVEPIQVMASKDIDVRSILKGIFLPGTIADKVANEYRQLLFGSSTLQDLPDSPRFVINATNVQSGVLWRFSKPYIWDWRVGEIKSPNTPLAVAVGASSAFPPFLSPVVLKLDPKSFEPGSGTDMQEDRFRSHVVLTDGGVYDNLGLETAFKRYRTLLVSDAGGQMQPEQDPAEDWLGHTRRVLDVVDNQVRSLRKRQLISSYQSKDEEQRRNGAFWSIRDDINEFGAANSLNAPFDRSKQLAAIPTRLDAMDALQQQRLINWGYAISDAAIRKYWKPEISAPNQFPFPEAPI